MPVKQVIKGKFPVKVFTNDIEESAYAQLQNISNMPFIHKHVAAMPDVHWGIGATIGSVIPTKGAIIPAAVGVDIGCGMMASRTTLFAKDLPDNLKQVRLDIEDVVPHGFVTIKGLSVQGGWVNPPANAIKHWQSLSDQYAKIYEKNPGIGETYGANGVKKKDPLAQLGSLGGGNHFIEICLDESDQVWIMLHSGSRGIGNMIGRFFIEQAKNDMRRHFINLPDENLAYLVEGTEHFDDYWEAMSWAQDYASQNRQVMMHNILMVLRNHLPTFQIDKYAINCHHNYASIENHFGQNAYVTRKGAIRARKMDLGIIPGSMGAKSYIVQGLGNKDSFCSCSHGAGRKFSRAEAKRRFTTQDLRNQTQGVECPIRKDVVDEIPSAYKDIDVVMENQNDLVEVLHTLKQVVNVKG